MDALRYKLIAIDLDGTLLDSQSQVPERNRRAIAMARERGVMVVICTGRGIRSTRPILEHLQLDTRAPVIFRNGSIVRSELHGVTWYRRSFLGDEVKPLLRRMLAAGIHPVVCVDEYPHEDFYLMDKTLTIPVERDFYYKFHGAIREVPDLLAVAYPEVSVVGARGDTALLHGLQAAVQQDPALNVSSHVIALPSGVSYFEGHQSGTSKWAGLEYLLWHFGWQPADVLAIGDAMNDVQMIRSAGYGVAMANSDPACHAAAKEIAPPNDDCGVAYIIEKHLGNGG